MNKSLILGVAIGVFATIVLVSVSGVSLYLYKQNKDLRSQVASSELPIEEPQSVRHKDVASTTVQLDTEDDSITESPEVVTEYVYIPTPVTVSSVDTADNSDDFIDSEEIASLAGPAEEEDTSVFTVTSLSQGIIEEDYYSYGYYVIELLVTPDLYDIYIKQTTTDKGHGVIAFQYSITGAEYVGYQNSDISCSRKQDGLCKFKPGSPNTIEVVVWLNPDESGNHAVSFDSVTYFTGDETKTFQLDAQTATLAL